jgi:hypothetical protein
MGVRSPPDLRYLYTQRPRSPTAPFPPGYPTPNPPPTSFAAVPLLSHPTPRSTSLQRGADTTTIQTQQQQQKPVLPTLLTNSGASTTNTNGASRSTTAAGMGKRVPPPKPKRKAPSPYEPDDGLVGRSSKVEIVKTNGHRQNQPSSSTFGASTSDSHGYGSGSMSGYDASGWVSFFSFLF